MPEPTGVGGFKEPEPIKKPEETKGPEGEPKDFHLNKGGGGATMNSVEMMFIDNFGPEKGKKAYETFIKSFMITAVNQMHAASQAALQREKEAQQGR